MVGEVLREEFQGRVGVLESEVEGEKLVTRYILEQTRRNGEDLATLKTRLDRLERSVDGMDAKLDALDRKFDGLTRNLPQIVVEAVREAFRERDGR
jgi:uncharacterized protein YoxC